MRPSEVVVLAVEVAFAGSALVVVLNDGILGVVPVVGQDAPVHIFGSEEANYFLNLFNSNNQSCTWVEISCNNIRNILEKSSKFDA